MANEGIGSVIWQSWQVLSLDRAMVGFVMATVVGFAFYMLVELIARILSPWHKEK